MTGAARARVSAALCAAPVAAMAVLGWSRRWTADDGFINLRIVSEVVHGHGPVFNPGERVEAGTSTLWVALLALASRVAWFARLEWVAVAVALALAVASLVLAGLGARSLLGGRADGRVLFPAGLAVVAALPPVWDFATSGLEVSLSFCWLALSFLLLARTAAAWTGESHGPRPWVAAVVVGLGPLVRPDFAVFSAFFVAALVIVSRRRLWGSARLVGAAVLLPALYQVFRMAYYGALVPNTAFAKEASRARWGQGVWYVRDFAGPYWLWLAGAVLAALLVVVAWRVERAQRWVAGLTAAAGLVHALYVVRVGADFMHGRMLLPALFALALPVAVVPVTRETAVALVLVPWAVAVALWARPAYAPDGFGPHFIADERHVYELAAKEPHPVTTDDYAEFWTRYAKIVRASEPRVFLEEEAFETKPDDQHRLPLASGRTRSVIVFRYVGMLAYAAGPEVTVDDLHGLADPIGSRLLLDRRARPGHEKLLDLSWPVARYAAPRVRFPDNPGLEARVIAARDALHCGPVKKVMDAVTQPLSWSRLVANVRVALTTYGARFGNDPVADRAAFCHARR